MLGLNREKFRRRQLVSQAKTDLDRWAKNESFNDRWEYRSVFAAAYCIESVAVCDIGCGMQKLKRFLKPNTSYLPVDLQKRTDDTLLCNLNDSEFPTTYVERADTITMLGVLEYINDVPGLLEKLAQTRPMLVLSYNLGDLHTRGREANGWVNSFTLGQLAAQLVQTGYVSSDVRMIDASQVIIKALPII